MTVDELTVDELTLDELTWYLLQAKLHTKHTNINAAPRLKGHTTKRLRKVDKKQHQAGFKLTTS